MNNNILFMKSYCNNFERMKDDKRPNVESFVCVNEQNLNIKTI